MSLTMTFMPATVVLLVLSAAGSAVAQTPNAVHSWFYGAQVSAWTVAALRLELTAEQYARTMLRLSSAKVRPTPNVSWFPGDTPGSLKIEAVYELPDEPLLEEDCRWALRAWRVHWRVYDDDRAKDHLRDFARRIGSVVAAQMPAHVQEVLAASITFIVRLHVPPSSESPKNKSLTCSVVPAEAVTVRRDTW